MTLNVQASKLGVIESIEMECDMNLYDELLHELRLKVLLEEINNLRLQREAARGRTPYDNFLALIGGWMIFLGNKLCQRNRNAAHDPFLAACQ